MSAIPLSAALTYTIRAALQRLTTEQGGRLRVGVFASVYDILARSMAQHADPHTPEQLEHNRVVRKSESPIEALLMFTVITTDCGIVPAEDDDLTLQSIHEAASKAEGKIVMGQQVIAGPYRADFIFMQITPGNTTILNVECDGYDYHSTPEAMINDYRRQRYFAGQRIFTTRFLGREIFENPRRCIQEIKGIFS